MAKTILILDDDDSVRESLSSYFEDSGWRTILSGSAKECFIRLEYEKPDGAIIDIRLPKMNGDTFIEAINRTHPTMACIIYTGVRQYLIPPALAILPNVFKQVFIKPCLDLLSVEKALNQQIKELFKGKINIVI